MDEKKGIRVCLIASGALFFAFLVLILLLKTVDVGFVPFVNEKGGASIEIGLHAFNESVARKLSYNETWYKISEILGIFCLLICCAFAVFGVIQLAIRKSLKSVDKTLYLLGSFFILVIVFYVFFELAVVNYRPAHSSCEREPSFPSSHTVLSVCVCLFAAMLLPSYIKNKRILAAASAGLISLAALTVLSRFLSGVHWATDIIGGILLSFSICFLFKASLIYLSRKQTN